MIAPLGLAAAAHFTAASAAPSADALLVVTVTVTASGGGPVSGAAIVRPDGTAVARSDAHGVAVARVAPGTLLEARAGTASSAAVAVSGPALQLVLRAVIGSVRARTATAAVHRDDVQSLLAGDPAAGLAYAPQSRAPSQGGSSRFRINGVTIELPFAPAGDAPPVPADLLESAAPERAADGSIETNYQLAAPSQRPAHRVELGAGSNDGAFWRATQTGPGYAASFAHRFDDGTFAGRTFRDASGSVYPHDLAFVTDAASVVLNRRFATSTLAVSASGSRDAANVVDDDRPGSLPLGFGPGNRSWGSSGVAFALWTAVRGRDTLHAIDVRYAGMRDTDLGAARRDGTAIGDASWGYRYSGRSEGAGIARTFGATSVSLDLSSARSVSAGISGRTVTASSSASDKVRVEVSRYRATLGISAERIDGAFRIRSLDVDASVRARLAGFDANVAAYAGPAQTQLASYARSFGLGAPATASFTCGPGSATVIAPSDTAPSPPRAATVSADLRRSSAAGTLQAGGFVSRIRNALVQAGVAGASSLSPAYLDALGVSYASVCGASPFAVDDTILRRWVSVPVLDQREWFVQAERRVGALRLHAFVERFDDVATVAPRSLAGRRTDLIAGAQLAHIVPVRAALTVSAPLAAATLAAGLRTVSSGNAYNRAPSALVDVAARIPLRRGVLLISAQNVFAAGGGEFAVQRGSVPVATTFGAPFPTLARPIPSSWSVRYAVSHDGR